MGKIVVSENVTLDGVIKDPAGDEGFTAGGWVDLIGYSPQLAKLALDEALAAGALLLGRRSYERLAARWPSRSGEPADRLNSLPKYVVSATLEHPVWNNSTLLKSDLLTEVSTLKQQIDGDIVIAGSFQLVRTPTEDDLVDELPDVGPVHMCRTPTPLPGRECHGAVANDRGSATDGNLGDLAVLLVSGALQRAWAPHGHSLGDLEMVGAVLLC